MTPIDELRFRRVLSRFPSGVTVVTAVGADGVDHGMTVSAFCSLSLVPPLILVCIDHGTVMHGILDGAKTFTVNILAHDQEHLARKFSDPDNDRFEGTSYTRGTNGGALLAGAAAWLECSLAHRYQGGDHTIFVGRVDAADAGEAHPLVYYRGGYGQIGR